METHINAVVFNVEGKWWYARVVNGIPSLTKENPNYSAKENTEIDARKNLKRRLKKDRVKGTISFKNLKNVLYIYPGRSIFLENRAGLWWTKYKIRTDLWLCRCNYLMEDKRITQECEAMETDIQPTNELEFYCHTGYIK